MRRSFTLIELVMIIIIVSIIAVAAYERINSGSQIQEVTDQLIKHIRYTQHLAMTDDVYIPSANFSEYANGITQNREVQFWYKKRWQIVFHFNQTEPNGFREFYYSIFRDIPWHTADSFDRSINIPASEESYENIAKDPLEGTYLTGNDWTDRIPNYAKELNLKEYFGCYLDTTDSKGIYGLAWNTSMRILFDSHGSPHYHYLDTQNSESGYDYLMKNMTQSFFIRIFCDNTAEERFLCIEPITGFVREVNARVDCLGF